MNSCANCGKNLNPIKAFIASRMLPVKCAYCEHKNYRDHSMFYYISIVLFSVGILALIFLAMSQGFVFSGKVFIGFLVVQLGIYLAETFFRPLKVYTSEEKEKDRVSGRNKAIFALVVILISVALYLWGE